MYQTLFDKIIYGSLRPENAKEAFEVEHADGQMIVRIPGFIYAKENDLTSTTNRDQKKKAITFRFVSSDCNIYDETIDISLPPYFNETTEIYYYLVLFEEELLIELLLDMVNKSESEAEIRLSLMKFLTHIETLLSDAMFTLKQLPGDYPYYQSDPTLTGNELIRRNAHYIFYVVAEVLTRLYLDVVSRFAGYLDGKHKTYHQLYTLVRREKPPYISIDDLNASRAITKAKKCVQNETIDLNIAVALLNELSLALSKNEENRQLKEALVAFENFCCVKMLEVNPSFESFQDLAKPIFVSESMALIKATYTTEIDAKSAQHERQSLINDLLEQLPSIRYPEDQLGWFQQHSVLRKVRAWLSGYSMPYRSGLRADVKNEGNVGQLLSSEAQAYVPDYEGMKQTARERLRFFSGHNIRGEQVMSQDDFKRLLDYTDYLIENQKAPDNLVQIPRTNLTNDMVKYTYYLIHKEIFSTRTIRSEWPEFLKKAFMQFEGWECSTIRTKFSVKPPSYEQDMAKMLR